MRIALIAVGFFAGQWLHQTVLERPVPVLPQHFALMNIRHTMETNYCNRVRLAMRAVSRDGMNTAVLEPVLVCDHGAKNGMDGSGVKFEDVSHPLHNPCTTTSQNVRCVEGL